MQDLIYLRHYSDTLQQQVCQLLAEDKLGSTLQRRYPTSQHNIQTDNALYEFTQELKRQSMRSSEPVSKVIFDPKIHIINNALGTHTQISRIQGGKLKSKNEIRIAALLKQLPLPLLQMVVVHELAHLREKDHNKAFYKLCQHMLPDYHQLELDLRLYLTLLDHCGKKVV